MSAANYTDAMSPEGSNRDFWQIIVAAVLVGLFVEWLPLSGWPKVMLLGGLMAAVWIGGSAFERAKKRRETAAAGSAS
ncbi:MAG: hypothetical protein F4117_05400 [Acidimicrobiales bacterium]|nr:hypothetical protein [Acidimicrobiales bacterium]MXX43249.1 hypothetical protein [Acidimicrobiales bacterium]MYB81911.1 hypothetical protein [Acidimicrobiales bacterium]MYD32753.1 hypothetical protein [Acidimicrobiales bacterium]MYI08408.1 hypothetical protein [Acidimicrobiales bacterium]